jgi:hypothetical protein
MLYTMGLGESILTDMMAYVDEGDKKRTGLPSTMSVAGVAKLRGILELLGLV